MATPNWLAELLTEAAEKKWCNNIGCTTCGAYDFRSALARKLCERVGTAYPVARTTNRLFLSALAAEDFSRVADVALADLAIVQMEDLIRFEKSRLHFDMGMILSELRRLPRSGELASNYGATYARERAAAAASASAAVRKQADDHAEALDRRAKRKAAARERAERSRALHSKRLEVIEKLRTMSAEERLTAVAEDRFELPIDAIPVELLRCDSAIICKVPPSARKALAIRIDRRKGAYRTLRKALEDRLA